MGESPSGSCGSGARSDRAGSSKPLPPGRPISSSPRLLGRVGRPFAPARPLTDWTGRAGGCAGNPGTWEGRDGVDDGRNGASIGRGAGSPGGSDRRGESPRRGGGGG